MFFRSGPHFGDSAATKCGESLRRHIARLGSELGHFRAYVAKSEGLFDFGAQPRDHRRRRAARREQRIPCDHVEARITRLGNRRHVRHKRTAFGAGNGKRAQLAGFDLRQQSRAT